MKPLKHPLPQGRSLEQVWNHYQVESEIASRLKKAPRSERSEIFRTMYDELFAKVPDHPRLTRRADPQRTEASNRANQRVFGRFVSSQSVVIEFAPGDCEFSAFLAPQVKKLYGVDIGDQRATGRTWPTNFELIVYDGYSLPQIPSGSVDVVISNQLLEHFHPEDAILHLKLVHSLLRPGGRYVIYTPHASNGPWDVSRYFSDVPEGFHLKEWTYAELNMELGKIGYQKVDALWERRGVAIRVPLFVYRLVESAMQRLPRGYARALARFVTPTIYCVAHK